MNHPNRLLLSYHSLLLAMYLVLSMVAVIYNVPYHDTLYYWDWGRHLSFSYFDGPPMIAYLDRIANAVFGNSEWVLNGLAFLLNALIAFVIYRLARVMFGRRTGVVSALLWLLTASNFIQFQLLLEYDSPVCLFWMLTVYYFYLAHSTKRVGWFYLASLSSGCMMLSKYTGVLLMVSLLLMMVMHKSYRYWLKNVHTYCGILLALMVFSPVIIWNAQHHFVSFSFQLDHGFSHQVRLTGLWHYLKTSLSNYNVWLVLWLFICVRFNRQWRQDDRLMLLFYPAAFTLVFFAVVAPFNFKANWNEAFFLTTVITLAYYLVRYAKTLNALLALSLLSVAVIVGFITGHGRELGVKLGDYKAFIARQQVSKIAVYYRNEDKVFADDYTVAAKLAFYLPSQPRVYSLNKHAGQYYYWWRSQVAHTPFNARMPVLYITHRAGSLPFYGCHQLPLSLNDPLVAYRCQGVRRAEVNG